MTEPSEEAGKDPNRRCGRLRNSKDFDRVRAQGRSWSVGMLLIQAAPNLTGEIRIGMVASKRLGNAVRRNRVRRLIREAIRALCSQIRPGWDIVVVARSGMVGATYQAVLATLEDGLRRAGIFDGPPVANVSSAGGFPFVDRSQRTERGST
ncbi:MAG TPA: ribonuclease P protein component [Chloroflexota bacterium]|nr:ribonuclease P protein component [Chloroflexota bacterium]